MGSVNQAGGDFPQGCSSSSSRRRAKTCPEDLPSDRESLATTSRLCLAWTRLPSLAQGQAGSWGAGSPPSAQEPTTQEKRYRAQARPSPPPPAPCVRAVLHQEALLLERLPVPSGRREGKCNLPGNGGRCRFPQSAAATPHSSAPLRPRPAAGFAVAGRKEGRSRSGSAPLRSTGRCPSFRVPEANAGTQRVLGHPERRPPHACGCLPPKTQACPEVCTTQAQAAPQGHSAGAVQVHLCWLTEEEKEGRGLQGWKRDLGGSRDPCGGGGREPAGSRALGDSSRGLPGLAPPTHLRAGRLGRFQEIRDCPGQVLGGLQELAPVAPLILHERRQQLDPLGHLCQVGGDGGDSTAHGRVVRLGRVAGSQVHH